MKHTIHHAQSYLSELKEEEEYSSFVQKKFKKFKDDNLIEYTIVN